MHELRPQVPGGLGAPGDGMSAVGVHLCPHCQCVTPGDWDENRYLADGPESFLCDGCLVGGDDHRGTAARTINYARQRYLRVHFKPTHQLVEFYGVVGGRSTRGS